MSSKSYLNSNLYSVRPKEGGWDFRLHDTSDNGNELASVLFTVK